MEKDIISIQIFKNWLGGYKFSYYWQIFVNGEHWTTSKHGFSSEKSARFHGVLTLMAFDGFYSKWTLSE